MFQWHEQKRKLNLRKHGIDLAACATIFDMPMITREDDREHYEEARYISLGMLAGKVVILIWTARGKNTRFISCRKAGKYETNFYFENIG